MKITSKTTKAELVEFIQTLKNEAATARVNAAQLRMELDARVDRMGENKPWKMLALGAAIGAAAATLLWVVV